MADEKREGTQSIPNQTILDKISYQGSRILGYAGMVVVLFMVVITLRHAMGRYIFGSPMRGNMDIICMSVVVGMFLCMGYTMNQKGHIAVTLLTEHLPQKVRDVLYVIISIIALSWLWIAGIKNIMYAPSQAESLTTTLQLPKMPLYYVVGICFLLIALVMSLNVLEDVTKNFNRALGVITPVLGGAMEGMNKVTVGVIGLVLFGVLMFLEMPVSIAMGAAGTFAMALFASWDVGLNVTAANPMSALFNYTWSTVPMFVTMGYFAKNTGLAEDFYAGIRQWTGHLPGGLLDAVVIGNGAFGACSGDTIGAGVTFCSISLPETRKYGYDDTLTLGAIAGGSVLAALIPPSNLFIVFGATTQTSVGRLFMGGVFPGLLLIVMYIALITVIAKMKPKAAPLVPKAPMKQRLKATPSMLWLIIVFVVVIGGIYAGIFSPTEAGAFGCAAVVIIGLIRRRLSWKAFKLSLIESASTLGMIALLLAGSMVFQRLIVLTGVTTALANALISISSSKYMFFLIAAVLLIILGCFIDALPLLMLMAPILLPIAEEFGIDPIHFGVFTVVVILIGTLTPPVGIMVYALAGVVKEVPMGRIFKGVMPFILVMIIFTIIVVAFPAMSTWLPSVVAA